MGDNSTYRTNMTISNAQGMEYYKEGIPHRDFCGVANDTNPCSSGPAFAAFGCADPPTALYNCTVP